MQTCSDNEVVSKNDFFKNRPDFGQMHDNNLPILFRWTVNNVSVICRDVQMVGGFAPLSTKLQMSSHTRNPKQNKQFKKKTWARKNK